MMCDRYECSTVSLELGDENWTCLLPGLELGRCARQGIETLCLQRLKDQLAVPLNRETPCTSQIVLSQLARNKSQARY